MFFWDWQPSLSKICIDVEMSDAVCASSTVFFKDVAQLLISMPLLERLAISFKDRRCFGRSGVICQGPTMSFPTCLLVIQDAAMIFKMAKCLFKSRVVFKYPALDHFRFSLDLFISRTKF